jgi:hypothetical protein
VTSNAHAWREVAEPLEIRLWPMEIGADYLIVRTGRAPERATALALSETLGGLPLAHEQAAAYCERLDISFGEYHKRFEGAPARFLDDARHAPTEYNDGMTVAKSFALAITEAARLHPAAESLIVHVALLPPEPIPLLASASPLVAYSQPKGLTRLWRRCVHSPLLTARQFQTNAMLRSPPTAFACTAWCERRQLSDAKVVPARMLGALW